MTNQVNVITQDNWDEELTMAKPSCAVVEANLVVPPPKKLVQMNFFRKIIEEVPSPLPRL